MLGLNALALAALVVGSLALHAEEIDPGTGKLQPRERVAYAHAHLDEGVAADLCPQVCMSIGSHYHGRWMKVSGDDVCFCR